MNKEAPRLRMFAGPNEPGNSTLKSMIRPELLGIYINPNEIECLLGLKRLYGINSITEKIFLGNAYKQS